MKVAEYPLSKRRTLEIHTDDDSESPRKWDNNGRIFHWHPRYDLGEERVRRDDYPSAQAVKEWIEENNDVIAILPVYLYDHSGLTINTTGFSCPWDSGQVGWIVATRDSLTACGHDVDKLDVEKVKTWLRGEIETFDQFLRGDVYRFDIVGGKDDEPSCGGFYGSNPLENGMSDHLSKNDRKALQKAAPVLMV